MKILFFDTETTGLPRTWTAPVTSTNNWPRMVQLAWWIGNDTYADVRSAIVKPEGYAIPVEASAIHRVTQERAMAEGFPLLDVLTAFAVSLNEADFIVAHNLNFDRMIVGAEFVRIGEAEWAKDMVERPGVCTMRASTNLCQLPKKSGNGYKWPKLMELYMHLFGREFEGAHDALNDVRAGSRCYWELKKRGIV